MRRFGFIGLTLLLASTIARGDVFFLLPGTELQASLQLVFNDSPKVNNQSSIHPETKLKSSQGVLPTKAGGAGWLAVDATAGRNTSATIEHGVVLRGQRDPALVLFYPRHQATLASAISGPPSTTLEVEAVRRGTGICFIARFQGRELANADVLIYVPGEKRAKAARTDTMGTTTSFQPEGLYAARLYWKETKSGEYQGLVYAEVRHYATTTVNFTREK